jgi:hypothetical protein
MDSGVMNKWRRHECWNLIGQRIHNKADTAALIPAWLMKYVRLAICSRGKLEENEI